MIPSRSKFQVSPLLYRLVNLTKVCKIPYSQIPDGLVFSYGIILCNLKSFFELRMIRRENAI